MPDAETAVAFFFIFSGPAGMAGILLGLCLDDLSQPYFHRKGARK